MSRGFFITFEGIDGCGKSTQTKFLKEKLENIGLDVVVTREPGGCPISEKIREILLDKENSSMNCYTEALLYAAARTQHVNEVIVPALEAGKIVICDRFIDSSIAYQGIAREIGVENIMDINRFALQNCMPDATIFLYYNPEDSFKRMDSRTEHDRLESENGEFFKKVFSGFCQAASIFSDRTIVVNPSGTKYETSELIFKQITGLLEKRGIL